MSTYYTTHIKQINEEICKFPFGVLAAQPEEVAADLVPKILAQKSNGGIVEFLTTDRILTKFFERFILQKKSEYIDDDGNVFTLVKYDSTAPKKFCCVVAADTTAEACWMVVSNN